MAMFCKIWKTKVQVQRARKRQRREKNLVSAASVLSEEQHRSMEDPYEEFSQSTKIIILLQCSLQTDRNKLSKCH